MSGPSPLMMWGPTFITMFFFFALGGIVGSFINVVAYRLPRGLGIVRPPSSCPACGTRLSWSENLPIVGWLWLRGRCRYCKSSISPEYPIVESIVAVLFGGLYALWFLDPAFVRGWGVDPASIRPEWTALGLAATWPMFMLVLALIASLIVMTIIDIKTYTIPLLTPWIVIVAALVVHPAFGLWAQLRWGRLPRTSFDWTIWTFDEWSVTGAAAGALLGLGVSLLLIRVGLLRRSFADYDAWEASQRDAAEQAASEAEGESHSGGALGPVLIRTFLFTAPALALMAVGFAVGLRFNAPMEGMIAGMVIGLVIGVFTRRFGPDDSGSAEGDPIWVQYPHARREMTWELLFLAPAALCAVVGSIIASGWLEPPPLWIKALTGSVVGLLAGGGIIWAIRILGTFAFGKEAMGLGDVHLMAAVGAVLGWVDPVLAFFIAPFSGIAWAILSSIVSRIRSDATQGSALPYGPHLAVATIIVVYAKPGIATALSTLMNMPIRFP